MAEGQTHGVVKPQNNELEKMQEEDRKAAEKALEIMSVFIRNEAKNTSFLVRQHPKAQASFDIYAEKIVKMLQIFLVDEKLPEIHEFDKERIEASNAGFWSTKAKKKRVEREAQKA